MKTACLSILLLLSLSGAPCLSDEVPTDNPVAAFYSADRGYPAWTDDIAWSRVTNMAEYAKGKTNFEKFENARDELAKQGGGVLYYPPGEYDFSNGPFDGPNGRGLLLKSGVVIRGATPTGNNKAAAGDLDLPTKFLFGFTRRNGAINAGGKNQPQPETPRDWNLIGLAPEKGKRVSDVDNVGVVWLDIEGGVIYFGPDVEWGNTWATAGSWKSSYVKKAWAKRKPDGTHPWDPFAGGGKELVGVASGRLVFGCQLEQAVVTNDSVTMGRPDYPAGFGEDGYYMFKFGPRIGVYGNHVFVANNRLPISKGRNFKYKQTTRRTFPSGGGSSMGFDPPRESVVFFDYNKTVGIQINKTMLGLTKGSPAGKAGAGFFADGVQVVDNYVYNNGHKGFDVSGSWVTISRNHNERTKLREGKDPEGVGGWELTLDGHLESSPGGNGAISDNLSRAFDLAGKNVWVHRNTYNNLGSDPGNDGEGILCQAHGGSNMLSWAVTHNKHDKGSGETGYIGGWDVNMTGALFGWNDIAGWIGAIKVSNREAADVSFVGNRAGGGVKAPPGALVDKSSGKLKPPSDVRLKAAKNVAVNIEWKDAASGEAGYRIDRRVGEGQWQTIAYRPPQGAGDPGNPPVWVDYLAPRGVPLVYRVVAIDGKDSDAGASEATGPITLAAKK